MEEATEKISARPRFLSAARSPVMDAERMAPGIFLLVGVGMIVVAAVDYLPQSLGMTFAVLGVGLIVLGGSLRILEGTLKLGPKGLEANLRRREAIEAVRQAAPAAEPIVQEVIRYLDGTESIIDAKIRQQLDERERHKANREALVRRLAEQMVDAQRKAEDWKQGQKG